MKNGEHSVQLLCWQEIFFRCYNISAFCSVKVSHGSKLRINSTMYVIVIWCNVYTHRISLSSVCNNRSNNTSIILVVYQPDYCNKQVNNTYWRYKYKLADIKPVRNSVTIVLVFICVYVGAPIVFFLINETPFMSTKRTDVNKYFAIHCIRVFPSHKRSPGIISKECFYNMYV